MYIETFPWPHHPVDEPERTVQVFQLRPTNLAELLAWLAAAGKTARTLLVNGGPLVMVDGVATPVGLGDLFVLDGTTLTGHPADGFAQRYEPVE
jgi:hypothetical protein